MALSEQDRIDINDLINLHGHLTDAGDDPQTIIVEQEALGTSATTGEFALPNIVVLTVRNGQIARLRDYANILAAAAAMGRDI
ncbi:hypothetical protein ITP53_25575 [Nonomuraea sp. K274]|uniref:SnoaL-like domain-containing protein n=1 Tax=Nonomuraea cypriaca TaxID=1187855 RepID=A0A931ABY0_9ACTN|nr:hypothetical protein [Nonomuraea cypriaca]MBF8189043.1 hypothetical protein [Nonomuraea cypriaca]